jgi:hypothetical protein
MFFQAPSARQDFECNELIGKEGSEDFARSLLKSEIRAKYRRLDFGYIFLIT